MSRTILIIYIVSIVAAVPNAALGRGQHVSVRTAKWQDADVLQLNVENREGGIHGTSCANIMARILSGPNTYEFASVRDPEVSTSAGLIAKIVREGPYYVTKRDIKLDGGDEIRILTTGCAGDAYSAPHVLPQRPGQGCDMNSVAIDLGRLPPGANERIINNMT